MKVVELLKIGQFLLKALQKSCIKVGDVRYLEMYDDYVRMTKEKQKMSYISAVLSDKYNISERQFFYVIKRFQKDCKIPAS